MMFDYSISRDTLLDITDRYLSLFSCERDHIASFVEFVSDFDGADLTCRKNFTGHLTASAMIYDSSTGQFLLLKHRNLGLWLQPGGHIESLDNSLLAAARREVLEETGLSVEDYVVSVFSDDGFGVFEIDSHPIPENPNKRETAHFHHDVRFLFRVDSMYNINICPNESEAYGWFLLDELPVGFNRDAIRKKLKMIM